MKKFYFILFIIFIGLQSCGERAIIRYYYVLEIPNEQYNLNQDVTINKGICEILKAKITPAYNQQRIAVRRRSHEISYYHYHYWAINPAKNLTSLMEQQIQMSQIFAYSSSEVLKGIPDYQIALDVYKLEALDTDDSFNIQVEMRMELIEYGSKKTVVIHQFDKTKELENRDLNLFAAELSKIFQEESDNFISKIRSYFENNNPQFPEAEKSN